MDEGKLGVGGGAERKIYICRCRCYHLIDEQQMTTTTFNVGTCCFCLDHERHEINRTMLYTPTSEYPYKYKCIFLTKTTFVAAMGQVRRNKSTDNI